MLFIRHLNFKSTYKFSDCGSPNSPVNGSVLLADAGMTTYGAVATQFCDIGYNLQGEVNITCTADGNWSDPVAICQIKGILQNMCNKTLLWIFYDFSFLCLICLCASVYMCLLVTCWERADLLTLVCGVKLWVCHFTIGILGQVWYLIGSIRDLCSVT